MKLNNDGMGRYLTNIVVLFTADFFVVDPIKEEDKPKILKDKTNQEKRRKPSFLQSKGYAFYYIFIYFY